MISIKRVDIALTTLCNFTCEYCRGNPGMRNKIPKKDVFKIIDNFSEIGVEFIRLDGGEPFMYGEEIIDIIEYALSKNIKVGIFTNGSLIDCEMAKRLKKYSDLKLYVTLHILNKDNEFKATIRGLNELDRYNVPTELIIIVSKNHINSIVSTIDILPNLNYKITFRPIIPIGKAFKNMDKGFSSLNEDDVSQFGYVFKQLKTNFKTLNLVNEISAIHEKKAGYHNKNNNFILHVNTDCNLLPSFASGSSDFLGSALDKKSIINKLHNPETLEYLKNADSAVLKRIDGKEMPLQPNVILGK